MIRHKGVWHERHEDAPFTGALISAIDCNMNCAGCFNTHLKQHTVLTNTAEEIIANIRNNPFNKGIILGGLEWTLQADEALELILCALKNSLQVMLYTGLREIEFMKKHSALYELPIYIKFGSYDECQRSDDYYSFNVRLSSKNQYIKKPTDD